MSPVQPLLSPPSPYSVGESSLGLGHESEGAEDLTHLLLSLNTISFQVVHWETIVFLISPLRHVDSWWWWGGGWLNFSLWKSGLSCVFPDYVWSCGLSVCDRKRENVYVFPQWLMPEWDHQGCCCRWDVCLCSDSVSSKILLCQESHTYLIYWIWTFPVLYLKKQFTQKLKVSHYLQFLFRSMSLQFLPLNRTNLQNFIRAKLADYKLAHLLFTFI